MSTAAAASGRKIVKLDVDRHHRLKVAAAQRDATMIDLLGEAVDLYLDGREADAARAGRRKPRASKADRASA